MNTLENPIDQYIREHNKLSDEQLIERYDKLDELSYDDECEERLNAKKELLQLTMALYARGYHPVTRWEKDNGKD